MSQIESMENVFEKFREHRTANNRSGYKISNLFILLSSNVLMSFWCVFWSFLLAFLLNVVVCRIQETRDERKNVKFRAFCRDSGPCVAMCNEMCLYMIGAGAIFPLRSVCPHL